MPIDYSKYPDNWKTEIVPAVIKRAKNRCEICGVKNKSKLWSVELNIRTIQNFRTRYKPIRIWITSESDLIRLRKYGKHIKKIRVVLTVAHLDHDEKNEKVKLERLKAMCQWCHLNYDAKEKMRRIISRLENRKIIVEQQDLFL